MRLGCFAARTIVDLHFHAGCGGGPGGVRRVSGMRAPVAEGFALLGRPDYPAVMLLTLTGLLIIPESYISEARRWTWPTFMDVG